MSTKHDINLYKRIWQTAYPPRVVTAIMVVIYIVAIWFGLLSVLNKSVPFGVASFVSASSLTFGGFVGAICAWRGAYWLEGPMALTVSFGSLVVVLSRLPLIGSVEHFPLTMPMAIMISLFFINRVVRVWPLIYPAGKDPRVKSEVAVALAKEEYERAKDFAIDK